MGNCASNTLDCEDAPSGRPVLQAVHAELPQLLAKLQHPGAEWDKWTIGDLEEWCRREVRARPKQSAIAILVLSHEHGAMLDLICESFDGSSLARDAALRLRKGHIDFSSAPLAGESGMGWELSAACTHPRACAHAHSLSLSFSLSHTTTTAHHELR